ncbi:MAG: tyrosine-type recombinase/integrase [Campylobacterota bacterium]|nr:tyrosine-type recombinase/integrase [Campylobacterota bacterium]
MEKLKGSNVVGLYKNALKNKDIAYYYTLKINGKVQWFKVGTQKNGYRIEDARKARSDKYNEIHNIEKKDTVKAGRKKRTIPFFDEVFDKYIEYNLTHKEKTKTYKNYRSMYNNRIKKSIGHISIDKITQSDVENIILKYRVSKTDTLAPKTLNTLLSLIRMVYKYASLNDIYNGADITKNIKKLDIDNARLRYLSKSEINELLEYTKNNIEDKNVYICMLLALLTGARINVIVNIKVNDINLDNKSIKLFDEKGKKDKHYFGYINDKYFNTIKNQVEYAKKQKSTLILTDNSQDKDRSKYYRRRLQPIFDKLFNSDLDIKDITNRVVPHTLRHTFGSQLVINGVDIYTVQKLMNHKDLTMTMRYAKLNDDIKKEGVNKMDW